MTYLVIDQNERTSLLSHEEFKSLMSNVGYDENECGFNIDTLLEQNPNGIQEFGLFMIKNPSKEQIEAHF